MKPKLMDNFCPFLDYNSEYVSTSMTKRKKYQILEIQFTRITFETK